MSPAAAITGSHVEVAAVAPVLSVLVGLVGLVVVGPLIVMGLLGGSIADAVDRRRLTLVTGTALTKLSKSRKSS